MSDKERHSSSDSRPARPSSRPRRRNLLRKLLRGESLESVSGELPQSPYENEVQPEKRDRIDSGVTAACTVLGGLTGAFVAYGMAAHDFFVNFPFWKAAGLTLLTALGSLCAGVTLGCAGSFLVLPGVQGLLYLTWPRYRLALQNQHHVLTQESLYTLFAVNIYIGGVALYQRWDVAALLWVYWSQSVFIAISSLLVVCFLMDSGKDASLWRRLGGLTWGTLICLVLYSVPLGYLAEALIHIEPHPPWQVFVCSGLIFVEIMWGFWRDRRQWRRYKASKEDTFFWYFLTLPFYRLILLFLLFFMMYCIHTKSLFLGIGGLAVFMVVKIVTDQIIHARQLRVFMRERG